MCKSRSYSKPSASEFLNVFGINYCIPKVMKLMSMFAFLRREEDDSNEGGLFFLVGWWEFFYWHRGYITAWRPTYPGFARKDLKCSSIFGITSFVSCSHFMFASKACSYMFSFGKAAWHSPFMFQPSRLLFMKLFLYRNFLSNYSLFCSHIRGKSF